MVTRLELRGYAWFGVIFALGVVCGGAASHAYAEREYGQLLGADREEGRDTRRLEALARQLSLDAAQKQRLREVFERRRPERERRLAQMFETCGAPVLADKDELDGEIRALLRPEQRPNFEAFLERHRRFHPSGSAPKNPPSP
jgi:hypothetical protein